MPFQIGNTINLGRVRPDWVREKLSKSHNGVPLSDEHKKSISIAVIGDKNHLWKGDDVGYRGLHRWVERTLGKASKCSNDLSHQSTRFHWANISGKYLRDPNDWKELCPKCHQLFDRRKK